MASSEFNALVTSEYQKNPRFVPNTPPPPEKLQNPPPPPPRSVNGTTNPGGFWYISRVLLVHYRGFFWYNLEFLVQFGFFGTMRGFKYTSGFSHFCVALCCSLYCKGVEFESKY